MKKTTIKILTTLILVIASTTSIFSLEKMPQKDLTSLVFTKNDKVKNVNNKLNEVNLLFTTNSNSTFNHANLSQDTNCNLTSLHFDTADVTQQEVYEAVNRANHASQLLNVYWQKIFFQLGYSYSVPPLYIDYNDSAASAYSAGYVGYNPVQLAAWMKEIGNLYGIDGDTVIYTVMAHEWGHIAQYKLGVQTQFQIFKELQADQFAGSFIGYCGQIGLLEPGDLEEARTLMYKILGDDSPIDQDKAHGTGRERLANFDYGFKAGAKLAANMYLTRDYVYLFR